MNILYYGTCKYRNLETEQVHIYEVLTNLTKLGHNVVTLDAEHLPSSVEINANPRLSLVGWQRVDSFLGERFPLLSAGMHVVLYFWRQIRLSLLGFTRSLLRRGKIDIIYTRHELFDGTYILSRLFRTPLIKEVNGLTTDEMKVSRARHTKYFPLGIIDRVERFTLPKADRIIVVTSELKEALHHDYNISRDKIIVIENGANTELFKPIDANKAKEELNLDKSSNYICFVGSFERWQGIEYLINTIPYILEECPLTRLLIVGDGRIKKELIELAEQLGVSDKVIFTGMVPYEKVSLYVNASDVCVVPKKPLKSGYSPLKLCEYMACEKPVVATKTNGFEVLEEHDAGLLINPEDPKEFTNTIVKLLQNKGLRKQMGGNGRKYVVENQSWESVARKVAEVCESVVSGEEAGLRKLNERIVPQELKTIFEMEKQEVEREFAPYFYRYFPECFSSPIGLRNYADFWEHIFAVTQAEGKKVLDAGCGFGIASIFLAVLGAQKVTGIDNNEEKISVFQKILSRFDPPLTNIEVRTEDALSLQYREESFDVVIAHEVISHVRDLDAFLSEMSRVLSRNGILFISDGNNALNILQRFGRRKFWRRAEYGPVDKTSLRGTDKPLPWLVLRREMIKERFPHLDSKTLDLLARETTGLYGDQIFRAVEEYLREGAVLNKPAFKFRHPESGEYPEFEFNPYILGGKLKKSGFSAAVVRPYFSGYPILPKRGNLINLVTWITARLIRGFHPLSLLVAPHFEIIARKRDVGD